MKLTSEIKRHLADAIRSYQTDNQVGQTVISERTGVSQTTISNLLNPESATTPTMRTVLAVVEGLNLTVAGINAASRDPARMIPVVSSVQAGSFSDVSDPFPVGSGEFDIPFLLPYPAGPRTFALKVRGDSMQPAYCAGEIIIIDPDAEAEPNEAVVAKLENEDEATFKVYVPHGTDDDGFPIIELKPINQFFPTLVINKDNPGHIVGPLIGTFQGRRKH